MFEQTFKNIDDILFKDAGCSNELDYVEQTSCILFLKYLDALEIEKIVGQSLAQCERLHQSILNKAFEGNFVPQNANDEPAEKLLERIKKEKLRKEKQKL